MENIRKELKEDYNTSVDRFNAKDYKNFFRNIRPTIEWLSKLLIYDFMRDDVLAKEIINGEKALEVEQSRTFRLKEGSKTYKPQGKTFALIFPKVYAYRHPEIVTAHPTSEEQRLNRGLRGCGEELARHYDIASGFGSHTNEYILNPDTQATGIVAFINSFFDFLKSNLLISPQTVEYLEGLSQFNFGGQETSVQSIHEIEELINKMERQEAALLAAQAMQLEAEKRKLEAEEKNSSLESKIGDLEQTILALKSQLASMPVAKIDPEEPVQQETRTSDRRTLRLAETLKSSLCPMSVDEESMDDDQLDLIDMQIGKSMLVTGCAGSGKSVIAMYKAEQIAKTGASVILIAYTKSLSAFMREGSDKEKLNYAFYHHHLWKHKLDKPSADYIIVDEIQDFTEEEIKEFMSAAKVSYLFFGDSAQSIYKQFGKKTMSIEQISELTGLKPLCLYNNYRLPRSIAKITQPYVGVDVNPYEDKVYQNKEKRLPHFIQYEDFDKQILAIRDIIDANAETLFSQSIGILFPTNDLVLKTYTELDNLGVKVEFKYNDDETGEFVDNLDFTSSNPKILTYHSAKGLQFDTVILPMYVGATDDESRKSLYVAMTRAMHQLYIMYSTPTLNPPLNNVPSQLYLKK